MKIGIACYPTFGGSGVVASELGLDLLKRGHEVHIFSYALPFRLRGYHQGLHFHEIEVADYPLFKYPLITLTASCKMIEVAERVNLDVLHAHYALPWAICAHLAREVVHETCRRLKIVTTLHGTDITLVGQEPAFFKMTKFGIERSDAVTAVSRYLAEETNKVFNVNCPIDVIHNSVDSARFAPKKEGCCRKHFAANGEKLLIHCSNFRPVKNVPDVIKIFAGVHRSMPAKLLLVGEGPDLPVARQLSEELGVAKDVVFLGNQESVEEILPCGDLFLLPSAYESFGLAALEAMSCGLPVIATEIGGLGEVITPGVDGWLCKVGDTECMADRAADILGNPAKQAKMGAAAREKAVQNFSAEIMVKQYEKVYAKALESSTCRA